MSAQAGVLRGIAIAAVAAAACLASCRGRGPLDDAVERARHLVWAYQEECGAPALQIAVGAEGRIVWSEAFGLADRERGIPATSESRFRIASISKLLTGTLAARLAASGRLDMQRPLTTWVEGLPAAWEGITARMLVSHTSGIGHYTDPADALDTTFYPTTRAALARFRDRPLAHPPGSGETYSSYAYSLLALAMEEATGKPFLELMDEEILAPLGMSHTGPDVRRSPPAGITAFYSRAPDGRVELAPEIDLSGRWAGSGFLSTAEDLVRFGMAHTRSGGQPAAVKALVAEQLWLPDGKQTREGFGWGPRTDWDERQMLWGDGSTPGARCGLLVYPQDDLSIAMLANARGIALERGELQTIARLFLAALEGATPRNTGSDLAGPWTGTMETAAGPVGVEIGIGAAGQSERGLVAFSGWRSLNIVDAVQLGDTTWIFPLDGEGFLPLTLARDGEGLKATVPRAGLSFELRRPSP